MRSPKPVIMESTWIPLLFILSKAFLVFSAVTPEYNILLLPKEILGTPSVSKTINLLSQVPVNCWLASVIPASILVLAPTELVGSSFSISSTKSS